MQLFRNITFWLFAGAYLVLCPMLILYALGYTAGPLSEPGIIQTGLLHVDSVPENADIFLENRRFSQRTPATIQELIPGDYQVRVAKKNYQPWAQTVTIKAGRSLNLDRVLLLPKKITYREVFPDNFEQLILIEETPLMVLVRGKRLKDFFVFDRDKPKSRRRPFISESHPWADAVVSNYAVVPKSTWIFFTIKTREGIKHARFHLKGSELRSEDMTAALSGEIERISWLAGREEAVFYQKDDMLYSFTVEEKISEHAPLLAAVRGFGLYKRKIFALQKDFTFLEMDDEGKKSEILLTDSPLARRLFGGSGDVEMHVLSERTILFLNENGRLTSNRLPYEFSESGVIGLKLDARRRRALFWRKDAIGIIDFSSLNRDEDQLFESGPELRWIYKEGNDIYQASWAGAGAYVIFSDGGQLFLIETGLPVEARARFLLETEKETAFDFFEEDGLVFYLDPNSSHVWSARIYPAQHFFSFTQFEESFAPFQTLPEARGRNLTGSEK